MARTYNSEAMFLVPTSGVFKRALHYDGDIRFDIVKNIYGVVLFFFEYLLPIAIFVICYTRMFICLRNQNQTPRFEDTITSCSCKSPDRLFQPYTFSHV